jgi:hypothetical protein
MLNPGHVGKQIRNAWKVLKRGAGEGWRRSVQNDCVKNEALHTAEVLEQSSAVP